MRIFCLRSIGRLLLFLACVTSVAFADELQPLVESDSSHSINRAESQNVGEKIKYQRRYNFRIDPIMLAIKEVYLDFQIRLTDQFSIGPVLARMSDEAGIHYSGYVSDRVFMDDKSNRNTIGMRAVYYFENFNSHSPFLSLRYRVMKNEVEIRDGGNLSSFSSSYSRRTGHFTETASALSGGFRWVWGRITMSLGGGVEYFNSPKSLVLNADDGSTEVDQLKGPRWTALSLDSGIGFQF